MRVKAVAAHNDAKNEHRAKPELIDTIQVEKISQNL